MADGIIQLPYTGTSSGKILDATELAVGANTVERERMVIAGDTATALAPVTSSAGLMVNLTSGVVSLSSTLTIVSASSGLVQISGTPTIVSASSGLIQVLQSTGVWAISGTVGLSSGTVTLSSNPTIISASSGLVQVLQSTGVWAVSGTVTLSSNPVASQIISLSSGTVTLSSATSLSSGLINVTGSSGAIAQVTSSGGMWVQLTNASASGGSTDVSVVGSTGTQWVISSAGVARIGVYSSGGIGSPVTSSYGLLTNTPATTIGTMTATVGAPVLQILTTAPIFLYSLTISSTSNAGNIVDVFSATSATSTDTPLIRTANIVGGFTMTFNGASLTKGISMLCKLTAATTGSNTSRALVTAEYLV